MGYMCTLHFLTVVDCVSLAAFQLFALPIASAVVIVI